jgi:hypothetical protein
MIKRLREYTLCIQETEVLVASVTLYSLLTMVNLPPPPRDSKIFECFFQKKHCGADYCLAKGSGPVSFQVLTFNRRDRFVSRAYPGPSLN